MSHGDTQMAKNETSSIPEGAGLRQRNTLRNSHLPYKIKSQKPAVAHQHDTSTLEKACLVYFGETSLPFGWLRDVPCRGPLCCVPKLRFWAGSRPALSSTTMRIRG